MSNSSLKNILADVELGKIVLPEFQRDFVWKPADTAKLVCSIFNNYPIGAFLLMENSGVYQCRPIEGAPEVKDSAETTLVLDGQQRITSCYRAFYGSLDIDSYPGRYYFDYEGFVKACEDGNDISGSALNDFIMFENAKNVKKFFSDTTKEMAAGRFPLDIIFRSPRGSGYSEWLNQYSFNRAGNDPQKFSALAKWQQIFIQKFVESVTGYQTHFEKITRDTDSDVICTIFETINTTGKKLTVFDLLVAKCFKHDVKLRDKMLDFVENSALMQRFDSDGSNIFETQVPRIIALMHNGQCKRGDILELKANVIAENWERACKSLEKALDYVSTRYGAVAFRFLPSTDILGPMAAVIGNDKFNEGRHLELLDKWYWRTVFSQYFVGSTETKVARVYRDFVKVNGWLDNPSVEPQSVADYSNRYSILDDVARSDSSIYRGVLSLLIKEGVPDFSEERKPINSIEPGKLEDHHIFPRRFLYNHGIRDKLANTIMNRTVISRDANGRISSLSPSVYMFSADIVGGDSVDDLLNAHCIDKSAVMTNFSRDAYLKFLEERKLSLMCLIADAVKADPVDDED